MDGQEKNAVPEFGQERRLNVKICMSPIWNNCLLAIGNTMKIFGSFQPHI